MWCPLECIVYLLYGCGSLAAFTVNALKPDLFTFCCNNKSSHLILSSSVNKDTQLKFVCKYCSLVFQKRTEIQTIFLERRNPKDSQYFIKTRTKIGSMEETVSCALSRLQLEDEQGPAGVISLEQAHENQAREARTVLECIPCGGPTSNERQNNFLGTVRQAPGMLSPRDTQEQFQYNAQARPFPSQPLTDNNHLSMLRTVLPVVGLLKIVSFELTLSFLFVGSSRNAKPFCYSSG